MREPSDAEADAFQIALEEVVFGYRVSTNRDLGIVRQAVKAGLRAAYEVREKERE